MKITATNTALRIDFRVSGKLYSMPNEGSDTGAYPFDSATIQPGETWDSSGGSSDNVSVIRVVELGGAAVDEVQHAA
jgi:hypothetical protein